MTSRGTQRTKTSGNGCTERRQRTARRRQSPRTLALEPLESRQLLSAVPMNLDLLTERAFALSQETYQPVVVPPVEILDYPADYQPGSVGLVFQEKDAIRTANFLDSSGVYVKPHVRGSNNKMSMRIFVDENRDGWFDERFYEDAQADYSDPIIQPPIDPANIPPAGRVISQLSVGAPQPNQGCPQFLTIGAEGYGRFNGYAPQTVGSSFRVAASNIFSMNGQPEEFPFFREMYATILDVQHVRLLGLVDSEDFTGAVSLTLSPGPQTVFDVDGTWFPRRELVAGGSGVTAFLAYSSMFWKDELDTPGDTTDEAHDIDRLVVGLDTNSDGLSDRVVTSRMALPRQEGEVAVTDFEQLYGGQPVFVSLDNRDRDPGHFQAYASADYATRASYAFEILHSDIAVGLRLYEQHTASEYHDNVAVAARVLENLQPAATVHDGIRVVSRHYAFFPIDSDADGLTDLVAGILGEQPDQQIEHVRVAATLEVPAQFSTIGAAIEAARPGDTIQVAAGTYVENLDIAKNGLRIVGAGAGLSILTAPAGSDAPAVRFRSVDRSTLLTGFSIQGGYATLSCEGGGIDIDNASPVIRSNEITGNSSRAVGGGIAVRGSLANPLIQDNEIHHNHTRVCHQGFCEDPAAFAGLGGGIYLGDGATGEILGNHIHHNAAWGAGGGIYSGELWAGSFRLMAGAGASVIRNNTIEANTADWDGGVVIGNLQGAVPLVLENNLITDNAGTYAGGSGIWIVNSNARIINNTVVGNRGSNQPGYGINASGDEPVEIRNNIVVENDEYGICAPPDAVLEYNDVYGHTVADYCVGTVPGIGSISVDPRFVAPENGDFHLQPDSPAVDAGDPAAKDNDTDGSRNDMGAFGGPFVTVDMTPPIPIRLTPPDEATDVATGTSLVITFNENVQKGTGSIVIRKSSDHSVAEVIAVTSEAVSVSGQTATIIPAVTLAPGTSYCVEITAGTFKDLTENDFEGIGGAAAWNFTTIDSGLVQAVALNWLGTGTSLSLTQAATDARASITISEPAPKIGLLKIDLGEGYVFASASTTSMPGLNYQYPGSPTTSQFATIDVSVMNRVSVLEADLPGANVVLGPIRDLFGGLGGVVLSAAAIEVAGISTFAANGNVDLKATGNITVAGGAIVQTGAGTLSLAADVKIDGTGDDGKGTLNIGPGAMVVSTSPVPNGITLRGADIVIDTSENPALVGAQRSLATSPNATLTGLSYPNALAFDGSGNLYVANQIGGTVSKYAPGDITPRETLTVVSAPYALAIDASGNLFVAHNSGISRFAPGSTTPNLTLSGLQFPVDLAFDAAGNLYVADRATNSVSKFAPGRTTPSATLTGLDDPMALAFDGLGNLYVANWGNASGTTVSRFAPGSTTPNASLIGVHAPNSLAFDGKGNLYVANWRDNTVSKFAPGSTTPAAILTELDTPYALACDGTGNLYVANDTQVSKFAPEGTTPSATLTGVNSAINLAFDRHGSLYVVNGVANGIVSKFVLESEARPTAHGVAIRSSLSSRPMSLGGELDSLDGINLTDAELAQIETLGTGTLTIGDAMQTGSIAFTTAKPAATQGVSIHVMQSGDGPGRIILDTEAGIGLDGNGGEVILTPGTGGIVSLLSAAGMPLATEGFNAEGLIWDANLRFAPASGTQLMLINNTATPAANNPILGTITNLPQDGALLVDYADTSYVLRINYQGGDGNDLVLTAYTDTTAPTTSTLLPADDAAEVSLTARLVLVFTEPIQKGLGSIVLRRTADDSIVQTISVASAGVTIADTVATIDLPGILVGNTSYYVEVEPATFKDLSGNAFAGIVGSTAWNFTTVDDIQPGFVVTGLRSLPSGFAVDFSTPFTPAELNLTDQQSGTLGPADITLVGAVVGEVRGSVVLDADAQGFTFLKTGGPLEADTYTVRLRSAADGFVTAAGGLLDGNGDGTVGDDYVGTMAIVAPAAGTRTVSVGDFLRGPGQSVNLPASTTAGIPLTISDGTGVWAIDMRLRYDPALLQITGATTSVAGGAVQVNTTNPGEVIVVFYSTAPLAAGEVAFVNLQAEVPVANADAIYGAKHVLDVHSVTVSDGNDNEFPVRDDDGVHIVGYPADVSGNGRVNASDASLVARVAALLDDGFVQFRLADPVLVGDVSVNGRINSSDASLVARFAALISVPEIPPVPAGVVTSPSTQGPDPQLSLPTDLTAAPGESLTVPLQISVPESLAAPHRLAAARIVILFDKDVLVADAVTAAGVTAQEGWALVSNIDNVLGRIVIVAYTTHPVGGTLADLLANLQFTVNATASTGTTPLNIAASSGGAFTELLDESDGNLTLIPPPTDGASDANVDGLLTIRAPAVPVWHNAALRWDVNGDGTVTPLDVLLVINYLNSHPGDDSLPAVAIEPPQYYDVDNDGRGTAADALSVVNYLNANAAQPAEAESPFSRQTADTSDVWLIDDELIDVLAESLAPLEFTL